MDTVDKATRSRIMSLVGQKDTGPETALRLALHKLGVRYRLHDKSLPGSPDLVFPRYKAVVFVHGCYWHSHGCYRSTIPKTRRRFWTSKFLANKERDERIVRLLAESGWRVMIVWECTLIGKTSLSTGVIAKSIRSWLINEK
jgi:DNA mismatch endonuclease, patch repair protein